MEFSGGTFGSFGGFLGEYVSGYLTQYIPSYISKLLFISFVIFAIVKVILSSPQESDDSRKTLSKKLLLLIGFGIGIVAISIGVGGGIILVPLLSGVLGYPLKRAVSAGLFFVVFSICSEVFK